MLPLQDTVDTGHRLLAAMENQPVPRDLGVQFWQRHGHELVPGLLPTV